MALSKFEDYKAPWETAADGKDIPAEDQKLDPERLKKLFYNQTLEKEKAQTARDAAVEQVTTLTSKVTELEKAAETKSTEGLSEIEKLTKSVDDLRSRAEKAEFERTKLQVITDNKIDPKAVGLLTGTTEAELKASAQTLVDLGLVVKTKTTDDEKASGKVDEAGNPLETKPKQRHNAGDPDPDGDTGDMSPDDFVKMMESGQIRL